METAELRRAYDVLLAEADAGGFGPPPSGELTAEQVVAHLAANDELLTEATEAVIAGSPWAYYDCTPSTGRSWTRWSRGAAGCPGWPPCCEPPARSCAR